MSIIKEDIKSQFKCGLSISTDDDHFLIEPILLLCGHSVCFGCLEDFKKNQFECYHCKSVLKKDEMNNRIPNQAIKIFMSGYLNDLNEELDSKIKNTIDSLNGKI